MSDRADDLQQLDAAIERALNESYRVQARARADAALRRIDALEEALRANEAAEHAAISADGDRLSASYAAHKRLEGLRPAALKRLTELDVRCPDRGCLMARCLRLGRGLFFVPTVKEYRGTFVDWPKATPRTLSATCRHGVASCDERTLARRAEATPRTVVAGNTPGVSWAAR